MSLKRVLRVLRRKTSLEIGSAEELVQVEFRDRNANGLDLRPSVYVLEEELATALEEGTTRVLAEHTASFLSPPRPNARVDFFDAVRLADDRLSPSLGETAFAYANSLHAEVLFENEDALLAFARTLAAERAIRGKSRPAIEVLRHAAGRIAAGDPEWAAALDPDVKGWLDAVKKLPPASPLS